MLRGILATVVVVSLAAPAHAVEPKQLEVLGVHLADEMKTSETRLVANGFMPQPNTSIFSCATTYEKRVAELVKEGRERFLPTNILCQRTFKKGRDAVQVDYLLAPRGFVVSGLEYSFRSTESPAAIEGRLVEKFGAPSERILGNPRWDTHRQAESGMPSLKLLGGDGSHNLLMHGGTVMTDTFVEEVRKDVKRRMPATRPNL